MSERGEIIAEWVVDLRGIVERQLTRTPDPALHWRPTHDTNSIGAPCGTSRHKGVVQGIFAHLGEIAALMTLFERETPA